ncbi:Protein of unknown function [Microlunatus sagamiharensis]|uniref:DUF3349 domain-containing protein n=1 Tax=Microlunatus sagamiharensis TaxID=546874 RepID=A0A1H2M8P0_9ACTN|nr:DUF3349 domain-containing protein [Microlunatus sagamiharensis]SDU89610.1 Protein of unknown function [Microlunatus sagamiharensis]
MGLSSWVTSVVGWLKAGYPEGVPTTDYVPLLAVLARRLSTDEVRAVAAELVREGRLPVDDADIGTVITKVIDELPCEEDVARVRTRLALGGWPLADPRTAG